MQQRITGHNPPPSLIDLPQPALADLFSLCQSGDPLFWSKRQGHPLLGIARAGRDAVLTNAKRVALRLEPADSPADVGPLASLLQRACSQAAAGLKFELQGGVEDDHMWQIPLILRSGVERGGWRNVSHLKVGQVVNRCAASPHAWKRKPFRPTLMCA